MGKLDLIYKVLLIFVIFIAVTFLFFGLQLIVYHDLDFKISIINNATPMWVAVDPVKECFLA